MEFVVTHTTMQSLFWRVQSRCWLSFPFLLLLHLYHSKLSSPFEGTLFWSLSLFCTDVMASRTERQFASNWMLDALSNSSANIFASCEIWSWGGMINDPMFGPLLQATSELLMSCLIFQISTFLLAALGSSAVFPSPPPLGPVFGSRGSFTLVLAQM